MCKLPTGCVAVSVQVHELLSRRTRNSSKLLRQLCLKVQEFARGGVLEFELGGVEEVAAES